MPEFRELVKQFEKIRSYVREFYIYGFKTREEYTEKSPRTYDNERRRIESWFSGYIRQEYREDRKKAVYITLDSNRIAVNPLYHAWKAKSFTDNDILLHFLLLDVLADKTPRDVETIADELMLRFQRMFETQTIRRKLVEYEKEGLVRIQKEGRKHLYTLAEDQPAAAQKLAAPLLDAVCFFQGAAPFGFVGSTILDACRAANTRFRFRHDFLVHTLEDEILLPIINAIREQCQVTLDVKSTKKNQSRQITGTPLKIFISTQTGRRYVCMHKEASKRLACYRLDSIRQVKTGDRDPAFPEYEAGLARTLPAVWGVSFGSSRKPETICLRITLNEDQEQHILTRLEREGRGGTITRLEPGLYQFTRECWDAAELVPWIRTFTGRIRSFTCSNPRVEQRFWKDVEQMKALYSEPGGTEDEPVF